MTSYERRQWWPTTRDHLAQVLRQSNEWYLDREGSLAIFGSTTQVRIKPILYGFRFYMRNRRNTGDDFYNVVALTTVYLGRVFVRWDYHVDPEVLLYLTDVPRCGLIRATGESAAERLAAMEAGHAEEDGTSPETVRQKEGSKGQTG